MLLWDHFCLRTKCCTCNLWLFLLSHIERISLTLLDLISMSRRSKDTTSSLNAKGEGDSFDVGQQKKLEITSATLGPKAKMLPQYIYNGNLWSHNFPRHHYFLFLLGFIFYIFIISLQRVIILSNATIV